MTKSLSIVFCSLICLLGRTGGHVFDEKVFLANLKESPVIQQLYYPYLNRSIDLISYLLSDSNSTISDQCATHFNQIKSGLLAKQRWALLYYESNGFPKNGRLNGDYNNLGYYDQCLSIGDKEMKPESSFDTKFCLISVSTPEWSQLVKSEDFSLYFKPLHESTKEMYKFNFGKIFGVCLPASCDTQSVLDSVNRLLLPHGLNATSQRYCSSKASKLSQPFNYTEIIALAIFGCTTGLCLLSYVYPKNSFLVHFNIRKNAGRVYDYDPNDKKASSTDYLHGLKSLLVASSIMLHCFGIVIFHSPFLFSKIRYYYAGTCMQLLFDRVFLLADQLFFFGGFFAMFSWYDSIKKISVTPYRYVFTRFLRIFTVSVMVILLTFLMPLLSTGPYYLDLMQNCSSNCVRNFWKNLLLINNQGSFTEICFLPTWYLSADFQLYLLNYFLLHLLVKNAKLGLKLAAIQMLVFSTAVILYDYLNNIPYYYKLTTNIDSTTTFRLEEHYLPTIYHANTFVFGILTAWSIKSRLKFKFLEKQSNRTLITIAAYLSILVAMTLPELWESNVIPKNKLLIIVWSVIDKFLVCFSISWLFYAISNDYFPLIHRGQSNKLNYPTSDSSYSSGGYALTGAGKQSRSNERVEYCVTKEKTQGICVRVRECSAAIHALGTNKPSICYWDKIDHLEPIICCSQDDESLITSEPILPFKDSKDSKDSEVYKDSQSGYHQNDGHNSQRTPSTYSQRPHTTSSSSQQHQQKYVGSEIAIRDPNKPIFVRPPSNRAISQNNNNDQPAWPATTSSSVSSVFKRRESATTSPVRSDPVSLATTPTPPFRRTKNNENNDYNQSDQYLNNRTTQSDPNERTDRPNNNRNLNDEDSGLNSSRRNSSKRSRQTLPQCGKRVNMNNVPAIRIVKGNETKKSEFPWIVSIYIQSEYVSALDVKPSPLVDTPARSSKRSKNGQSTTTTTASPRRTLRPKFSAKRLIKSLVRDHLFGSSLNHLKRSKRFLSSFYPSLSANYYRTRPIRQSSSIDLQSSYRTIPLRANKNHLNNRMNVFFSAPIESPPRNVRAKGAPIVNASPTTVSEHPLARPTTADINPAPDIDPSDFSTENSNSFSRPTRSSGPDESPYSPTTSRPAPNTEADSDDYDEDSSVKLKQECAGSILSDRYILSAAHCFDNLNPRLYKIGAGSHLLKNQKMYSVQRIHMHPKYDKKKFYNDIAILELSDALEFDEDTQPICLPTRELLAHFGIDEDYLGYETDDATFEERSSRRRLSHSRSNKSTLLMVDSERSIVAVDPNSAVVLGWGSQRYGNSIGSSKLRKAHLKLVKQNDCDALFRKLRSSLIPNGITSSMLCASGADPSTLDELGDDDQENDTPDACQNDSGGPLFTKLTGPRRELNKLPDKFANVLNYNTRDDDSWQYNWIQIGIVSFGFRCGTNFPGVYTNVVRFESWINSIIT